MRRDRLQIEWRHENPWGLPVACLALKRGPSHAYISFPRHPDLSHAYLSLIITARERTGRGHARQLLEDILYLLDRSGVRTINLSVSPQGTHGLDVEQLMRWYERHGFVVKSTKGLAPTMARRCPR